MSYKASRSKYVTFCADCETTQGVVHDKFNRSPDRTGWRLTKHANRATRVLCTNSRAQVSDNVVFPNVAFEEQTVASAG